MTACGFFGMPGNHSPGEATCQRGCATILGMREIVQIVSLADPITVKVRKKSEPTKERRMTISHPDADDEVKVELETNPGDPRTTQLVALVQDGKRRYLEPVLPDGDGGLLPVGDIDDLEVVSITF